MATHTTPATKRKLRRAAEEAVKDFYLTRAPNPSNFVSYMEDKDLAIFVSHLPLQLISPNLRADTCAFYEQQMNLGATA